MYNKCWTTWHQAINNKREADKTITLALVWSRPNVSCLPLSHSSPLYSSFWSSACLPLPFPSCPDPLPWFCSSGHPDGATRSLPGLGRGGGHLHIFIFPPTCSQSLNTVIFINTIGLCISNVKPAADILVSD